MTGPLHQSQAMTATTAVLGRYEAVASRCWFYIVLRCIIWFYDVLRGFIMLYIVLQCFLALLLDVQ